MDEDWQRISQGDNFVFAKRGHNSKDFHYEDDESQQSFGLQSVTLFIGVLIGVLITRSKKYITFSLN
jgi:hypothetical protein